MDKVRLGIDFGGTKIEIVALARNSEIIFTKRSPTPRNYPDSLQAIEDLVRSAEETLAMKDLKIGVGTPGAMSKKTGLMKNSNSTWLLDQPLLKDLEKRLGERVRIANDANCFAISEASDGAAAGSPVVFGVILGTGVGGGLVIDQKIVTGINSVAGEWGHNPLPWIKADEYPGGPCYCGKLGCIESFLSGPALAKDYPETGLTGLQVAEKAKAGDREANLAFERYENRLARAFAHLINIVDPDTIVLGGGLSNIARIYENVPRLLPKYVFSDEAENRIVKAKYGDSSGVRGAAWLWE